VAKYGTQEYADQVMEAINSSPEYEEAAKTWEGDFYLITEKGGPIKEPIYTYLDLWHGKCRKALVTKDDKDFTPEFTMAATLDTWRKIADKKMEGTQAIVTRQMKLKGNMAKIMRNVKAAQALTNAINKVPVEWPQ
jgi:putative sterol carrier protein